MKQNKILTAEEFFEDNKIIPFHTDSFHLREIHDIMIQFARIHVEKALKESLESIPCLGSSSDIANYKEVEDAVLNAYPPELIK